MEKKRILDERQNGFRKGRGCNDNIMELVTDIRNGIYENKKVMLVFLDITYLNDMTMYNMTYDYCHIGI